MVNLEVKQQLEESFKKGRFEVELEPLFQLRVNIQEGDKPSGAEVLMTWKGKKPEEFIKEAKDLDIANEMYLTLIRKTIPVVNEALKINPNLKFAYKLYRMNLRSFDQVQEILDIFSQNGISFKNLEFEVDTNLLLREERKIVRKLFYLSITTNLVLENFGTHCLPLNIFWDIPIEKVKFSEKLIEGIINEDGEHMVKKVKFFKALVNFLKELDIGTVATGVRRRLLLDLLRVLGVNEAQGPIFAPFLTAEKFLQCLKNFEKEKKCTA